jgi:hypothetical protein
MQAVPAKRGRARFALGGRPGLNLSAQREGGKKTIQCTVGVIAERSHGLIVQHRLSPVSGFEQPRSGVGLAAIHPHGIFAEPVMGRRFAPTRWLAMTISSRYFRPSIHGISAIRPLLPGGHKRWTNSGQQPGVRKLQHRCSRSATTDANEPDSVSRQLHENSDDP